MQPTAGPSRVVMVEKLDAADAGPEGSRAAAVVRSSFVGGTLPLQWQELDLDRQRFVSMSTFGAMEMKKFIATAVGTLALGGVALAQTPAPAQILTSVPPQSVTVTDWYKQSVYDPSNSKIGEIMDVLLSPDGKVNALIVGVGGFLGMGEKDVAIPFTAIKHIVKDGKVYLTLDTTKDALKSAPGLKYDRTSTSWVPDTK